MPWLFVDYDQGAGGEYFCSNLSCSPECMPMLFDTFDNDRTKFLDRFNQAFLCYQPNFAIIESDSIKYEIVPSHRNTQLAYQHLSNVFSIRIQNPENNDLWKFIKYQQKIKVFDPIHPKKYFVGELKELYRHSIGSNFLKKVRYGLDGLSLRVLGQGLELTEENKTAYLNWAYIKEPEPSFLYDLTIKYEDLIFNTKKIIDDIYQTFGITVSDNWLFKYREDYEIYLRTT